jgi:hypothetical protein
MSGRKRLRASVRLIAKEDAIDRVPCSGSRFCFPNFHHRPDFSAAAHRTAFYRNRELGCSTDEHTNVAPDVFTRKTSLGTYQGLDEQVYLPKSPESFRTALVPRGSSKPEWLEAR